MSEVVCQKCGNVITLPTAVEGQPTPISGVVGLVPGKPFVEVRLGVNQITGAPATILKGDFEPISTISGEKGIVVSKAINQVAKEAVIERHNSIIVPSIQESSV